MEAYNNNNNNNNNNDNDNKFYPHAYPQPNMLVQSGSKVIIKGLTATSSSASFSGVQLNGLVGTALEFYADRHGHWSVQIDRKQEEENDENHETKEEAMIVMIPICHLEIVVPAAATQEEEEETTTTRMMMYFPIVTRNNPRWAAGSRNGRVLLRSGTMMNGQPALCLYDDPNRAGFDAALVYQQAKYMGASQDMVDELIKGCRMNMNSKQHRQQQQQQQHERQHQHQHHHHLVNTGGRQHRHQQQQQQHHHRSLLLSCVFVMIVGFSLLTNSVADKAFLLVPSLLTA